MNNTSITNQRLLELDSNLDMVWGESKSSFSVGLPCDLVCSLANGFLFVKDRKFLKKLMENLATKKGLGLGLIFDTSILESLTNEFRKELESATTWAMTTKNMVLSLSKISKIFYDQRFDEILPLVDGRQMSTAKIHPSANIAQNVTIGSHVTIGEEVTIHSGAIIMANVKIGNGSIIFPNVTLYPFVEIGSGCRIHSSSVIGADGFGYNFQDGKHLKVWHMGSVIIGDDVEIGANSCVDGGTFTPTRIGQGTKIDNHVQIGHNCQLGTGVVMCGQVGVGGSSIIGDFTVFGGRSAMGNGHVLGKACQVAGGAMVNADWPDGSVLGGHPARNLKEWMKGIAYVRKESLRKKS